MTQIESNWPILAIAILAVLLVAWWLFKRATTPQKRERRPDVLDEGAAPAQRNQALIDAAPAFTAPTFTAPAAGELMGGMAEVIAAAVQEETSTVPAAAPAGDDLTRIKGLGPKLAALLGQLGITSFAQIAAWTEADIAAIDPKLGAFAGRPTRDQWAEQARLLTEGDKAAYEAKFGKL